MVRLRRGFTLVELLVVIAIVGVLVALLLPAIQAARASARAASCKNNMRQIGLAVLQHCDTHGGDFPEWWHAKLHESDAEGSASWIYTLAPYLESVDEIRICPEDEFHEMRLLVKASSYVINDHLAADDVPNRIRNINKLQATSRTIITFEGADKPEPEFPKQGKSTATAVTRDHAHASQWFSQKNIDYGWVSLRVNADLQLDRHFKCSNYLYVDGHVEVIAATQIEEWIDAQKNFGLPE